MARKKRIPPEWTGIDVLLAACGEAARGSDTVDPEAVRVFLSLFQSFAAPELESDERLREIARRPASIAERAASGILETAIALAREHGSAELYTDVLGAGIWLSMRFTEYLEVFAEGDEERKRVKHEANLQRQRIQESLEARSEVRRTGNRAENPWVEGDRVQIVTGPFAGYPATVVGEEGDGRTIVSVRISERDTPVVLEPDQLRPDE